MKKLILLLSLSLVFSTTVLADKVFFKRGTGDQVNTSDSITLIEIIVKYGNANWQEIQYDKSIEGLYYNSSTDLFEKILHVDKQVARDAAKAIIDANNDVKKESLRLKLGFTKQEMDDLIEVLK